MITHRITRGWANQGASILKGVDVTGGAEINVDASVGAGTSVMEFALDVTRVQSFFAVSDSDVILRTNNGSPGVNVLTLTANTPFLWTVGGGLFSDTAGTTFTGHSITSLFVVNANISNALVQVRALYNP